MTGLLLTLAGAACLCLSMPKHYRQVVGSPAPRERRHYTLRVAGYLLLAAAVYACTTVAGVGVGLTAFTAYLTIGIVGIALLLPLLTDSRKRRASDPRDRGRRA